jgi:cold shock CspA family protein
MSDNRNRGTVVHWSSGSGYGFVRPDEPGRDLFFHVSEVGEEPRTGDRVSYELGSDRAQRPCAKSILFEAQKSAP